MELINRFYQPISAEEALVSIERDIPLPQNAVLVTIDDGYRDFQDTIYPITASFGIRPILFVPTAFVGQGLFWWDKLHIAVNYSRLPYLHSSLGLLPTETPIEKKYAYTFLLTHFKNNASFEEAIQEVDALYANASINFNESQYTLNWDELRELAKGGVTIAPHTHTHPILSHISAEQTYNEVSKSQEIIKKEIGTLLPIFAYPDGKSESISTQAVEILRELGIKMAFTMSEGYARLGYDNPLLLPRIGVWQQSLAQFHIKLTSLYYFMKATRNRS
jgi:peptidoglycan/xylan/chitin deacetylase (PgdA/CDA1 family)